MNYRDACLEGAKRLEKAGAAEAKLDAQLLLEWVCGTNRGTLLAHPELLLTEQQEKDYVNLIAEREKRIPLQYLIGSQNFMGLEFYVNQSVLVPRQDTELLVEEVMPHVHDGMRILDMCTGSGCILISLLQYSNHCAGVGADISEEALEIAGKNAKRILAAKGMTVCFGNGAPVNDEIHFVQGDLFAPVEGKFDILVSNPPYIATDVIATLEPEVSVYEPAAALDGGADGLDFYRRLIPCAGGYLTRGGMLFLEIGYDQADAVCKQMADAGFVDITVKKDYAGLNRVVLGTFLEERNV